MWRKCVTSSIYLPRSSPLFCLLCGSASTKAPSSYSRWGCGCSMVIKGPCSTAYDTAHAASTPKITTVSFILFWRIYISIFTIRKFNFKMSKLDYLDYFGLLTLRTIIGTFDIYLLSNNCCKVIQRRMFSISINSYLSFKRNLALWK